MLGSADLHRPIELQRRSRRARADARLRPVGARDEEHVLRTAPQVGVALDEQQPALRVADGDDEPRVLRAVDEQSTDDRHHRGERVRGPVGAELVLVEFDAGQRPVGIVSIGDLARERDPSSLLGSISAAPPNDAK